jgi:hypothetical protein
MIFDTKLLNNKIGKYRYQYTKNAKIGYLLIAMSWKTPRWFQNLSEVLIIAYPLILIVLLIARFIAGRSIKPISSIIETLILLPKIILTSRIPPQN